MVPAVGNPDREGALFPVPAWVGPTAKVNPEPVLVPIALATLDATLVPLTLAPAACVRPNRAAPESTAPTVSRSVRSWISIENLPGG